MVGNKVDIKKGLIIRNGLDIYGSWPKRVKHWDISFRYYGIETKIISAYPYKPNSFKNGEGNIYFILPFKLFPALEYIFSPFIIFLYLLKSNPQFILLGGGSFYEFFFVPLYCKIRKIPFIIDVVDDIGRNYKVNKNIFDYIIIYNKKLFDKLIIRHASDIFVISEFLKNKYKRLYPQKRIIKSMPTTVDICSNFHQKDGNITFSPIETLQR